MKYMIGFLVGILVAVTYVAMNFDLMFFVCRKNSPDVYYGQCQKTHHAFIFNEALVFIGWDIEAQRYTMDTWYFPEDSIIRWAFIRKVN